MTPSRPGKAARSSSSAVALVECSVRVSPTLARLIRKSAEKEVSGTSAKDALLTAAGVQPGEVATLQRELQRASEESRQWREKAAREHGQLEQSKIAAAKWDNERAVLRGDLRKATESLKGAGSNPHVRSTDCRADYRPGKSEQAAGVFSFTLRPW